jgi:hypothetical protein
MHILLHNIQYTMQVCLILLHICYTYMWGLYCILYSVTRIHAYTHTRTDARGSYGLYTITVTPTLHCYSYLV